MTLSATISCVWVYNPVMIYLRALLLLLIISVPCARSAAFRSGSQTCPTSGTKQLSTTAPTRALWISLQAPSDNTGVVAIGSQSVTVAAACAAATGNCLTASGSVLYPPISNTAAYDLGQTWFACTVAADKLMYTVLQ